MSIRPSVANGGLEFMAENFRRHQCTEVFNGSNSTASAKSNVWSGVIIAVADEQATPSRRLPRFVT
jgi:hypothetical protein